MVVSTNGCNAKLSPPGGPARALEETIHVGPQIPFDGHTDPNGPTVSVILSSPMRPQEAMLTTFLQQLPGYGAHFGSGTCLTDGPRWTEPHTHPSTGKGPSSQAHWSSVKSAEAIIRGHNITPRMAKPQMRETAKSWDDHGPSLPAKPWLGKPIMPTNTEWRRPSVSVSVTALCSPPTERVLMNTVCQNFHRSVSSKITQIWKTTKMFAKRKKHNSINCDPDTQH